MITIGVTGTGSLIGQAIIKSIRTSKLSKDWPIVGLDYFKNTIGSYWVNKNYLLPDILDKRITELEWIEAVLECISTERLQLIFIGVDFELRLFAKYGGELEKKTGCKIVVSDERVIEIADDKYLTYEFLKTNDLYYPKTFLPHEFFENELPFPLILKPRIGARSKNVFVINDANELREKVGAINDSIIQELVGDKNTEYTCGAIFFDHQVKEMIVLKRELQDGNTYKAEYNKSFPSIIYDYIFNIAMKLKPFGACNFQLRLDKNGVPKLFEINARHSGTTYIRSLFGFKEVEYIIRYLLGLNVPKFHLRQGFVRRYFEEMFVKEES